jgi:hypothetical protein
MYNSMVLQVEDCADVLNSLYPDEFEFLFLFDHSCGHDRMPDDALKVEGMNKAYSGEQNRMKPSTINSIHGFLGPYHHDKKLNVGDIQYMSFGTGGDEGPYWMTPKEREQTRKDQYKSTTKSKEYTKAQLTEMLREKGIEMPKETKNRSKQLPNEPVFLFRISVGKSLRGGKGNKKEWSRYCGSVGGSIQAETEACILSRVPKIPWVLFGRTLVYDT